PRRAPAVRAPARRRSAGVQGHRPRTGRPRPASRAAHARHRRLLCRRAGTRRVKRWLLACALALAIPAQAVELPATGTVEALFTPWDDAEGALIRAIDGARRDIHMQAFLFTSRNLARALSTARKR